MPINEAGMLSHTPYKICASQARKRTTPISLNSLRGSGQKMNAIAAAVAMATSSRFVMVSLQAIGFSDELLNSHAIADDIKLGK